VGAGFNPAPLRLTRILHLYPIAAASAPALFYVGAPSGAKKLRAPLIPVAAKAAPTGFDFSHLMIFRRYSPSLAAR